MTAVGTVWEEDTDEIWVRREFTLSAGTPEESLFFPDALEQKEIAFYLTQQNEYGLP
ncbi:DUF1793 domain-containing protein [Cesiribacter sp. SM1]|uniref:hypothetical protein n=1 Tax=Cesiribacter sp. SM1 TaxID=2861196 RepID=UPI001CD74FB1|nr:DUF1793 domain-containing protein [Cesiribacter sp. SM1]